MTRNELLFARRLSGLGEGYMPGITRRVDSGGVPGTDLRIVPGMSGMTLPTQMPLDRASALGSMGGTWDDILADVESGLRERGYGDLIEPIKGIFSGEYEANLTAMREEMRSNQARLRAFKAQVDLFPAGDAKDAALEKYNAAYAKQIEFENSTLGAIAAYNNGVWQMKSNSAFATILEYAPSIGLRDPQMLGLGVVPLVVVAVVAAIIVVAIAGAYGLREISQMYAISKVNQGDAKTLIDVIDKGGGSGGTIIGDLGNMVKYVAFAGIAFLAFKMIKDSGGLEGIKKTFSRSAKA